MNKRPLILVTNDDGVTSKGIAMLIEVMVEFGDVVVVAPNQSHSGMSHALTVKHPLFLHTVKREPGLSIYKTNGTPADCIKIGLHKLVERTPDFVVSGINHGSNSSVSLHYSGTVGGAREGSINGIPSIGFSLLDFDSAADFAPCKSIVANIFKWFTTLKHTEGIFFNVNMPIIPIIGAKLCRQARGKWQEDFLDREDPNGRRYFWLTGEFVNLEPESEDTDEWALAHGYASVVPCTLDSTDRAFLNNPQNKLDFLL